MTDQSYVKDVLTVAVQALDRVIEHPHGDPPDANTKKLAGDSAIQLCGGDRDKARTLWKLIQSDLGYVPHAAAVALIRAAKTDNLVPDIEAPVPG